MPQSTQVDLTFVCPTGVAAAHYYVDLARSLSAINRKLYRSGYHYAVEGFSVHGTIGDSFTIDKIPEGYQTDKAWNAVYDAWRRQRAETLDTSSQVTGRWSDFKPLMDQGHLQSPDPLDGVVTGELNPVINNGVTLADIDVTGGEWNRTDIVYDATVAPSNPISAPIGMMGANDPGVYLSCIEAWGDTRRTILSPDPNTPQSLSSSWLEHMGPADQELETEVEELIEEEGDQPPYAIVSDLTLDPIYMGGAQSAPRGIPHTPITFLPNTAVPARVHGGIFPLGLLRFTCFAPSDAGMIFTVHLARGKYKGVAARSMIQ